MCIVDNIQSSVCRLRTWQDVLSDRLHSVRQQALLPTSPALDPIVTRRMNVVQVPMVGIYHQGIVTFKNTVESTLRGSRSMKVKVVQLSDTHVMRVLSFVRQKERLKRRRTK